VTTLIEERHEAHALVEALSRQVRRNIERHASKRGVRCRYCPDPVTDPERAVLANGHVAHDHCVGRINELVDQFNHDRAAARLEAVGVVFAKPNLIVP
jgi:hypothetical protein